MTTPSHRSFHIVHSSRRNRGTSGKPLSSGDFCGEVSAEDCGPRAIDVHEIARQFPERWRRLMHEVYGGDVRTICLVFDCSERTAHNWLSGRGGVNVRHSTAAQLYDFEAYARIILGRAA